MDLKLFRKYIEICIELHKDPTWEGVRKFRGIFV